MRLVFGIKIVAERLAALVENHRKVGRPISFVQVFGQPPQHRRIAIDRTYRHPHRVGKRGQPMIGTEDIGLSVDQVEVLLGVHFIPGSRVQRNRHAMVIVCRDRGNQIVSDAL